ncbi:24966_t:CDS:2, partial [Gigaspora rosea]
RVCVPIQPDDCENLDPFEVPTVSSLYQELNLYIEGERKVHEQGMIKKVVQASLFFLLSFLITTHRPKRRLYDFNIS